ncbi:MAG: secondary thiamine-phosphate synthase enzyme YjbQ [Bacteroidales bacterium]|jgi:secondary thiamine-phosphate synthase enzyme|nr:secondary thiamine-phosphate synthase enzyme YjbQ [Bacteroidales bacterium]HOL96911.1 secondary thiamine-phosphate synthase enzyme YjbQ [Bacteroidales bacterium]HOM36753.1 secondary thiamine-phosphate synthase enzyme YjbQ [Bacteroidales bacterium]HPD24227.1 secondary thiamine-phosphate synthase enzyme YjbQ [Bacteroidales bacterium]HRS98468.1 secondary thiamine-phosphate synthase enzyme YjbQ [Bacteroidales bacterium]
MKILQKEFSVLPSKSGMNIITHEIIKNIPEIKDYKSGILFLFLKHTSASLTINENYDPTVQTDLNNFCESFTNEKSETFFHTAEGPDDMPAHILSSFIGTSINIPITQGRLNLGIWQGIFLFEHRKSRSARKIVATIIGD